MGVEPEDDLVSDKELKSLLERWVAPGPSRVLDKRIETSFAREFSGADRLSQPVLLPHRLVNASSTAVDGAPARPTAR